LIRAWLRRVTFQPFINIVVIKLLAPKHPGIGLALDGTKICIRNILLQYRDKIRLLRGSSWQKDLQIHQKALK
jgi:hypothetical protein